MHLLRPLRPVVKTIPVTQRWGIRDTDYAAGYHTGTDFGAPKGTRVRAPRSGKVIDTGYDNDYGNFVTMKDWTGRKVFLMAHLYRRSVVPGQRVVRGETLGYSGDTGNTRGAHLHAEQRHYPFQYRDSEKPGWE